MYRIKDKGINISFLPKASNSAIGKIKNNGDILEGELKLIEPLGNETLYHIKLDNINLISRHYEQKHSDWNLGMKVNVNFNLEKALFFDFYNKKRI